MVFDNGQPFGIREERVSAAALTMRLYGEFDLACQERFDAAFQRRVAEDGLRELVIDMSGVSFIDSSAIRMLLDAKAWADRDGFNLFVSLPRDGQVRKMMELTGLDEVFSEREQA
jgi:anti-anti-sigma factor